MPSKTALKKKPAAKYAVKAKAKPVQKKKPVAKAPAKKAVAKKPVQKAVKAPVKVVTAAMKKMKPANMSHKPEKVTKLTHREAPVQQTAKTLAKAPAKSAANANAAAMPSAVAPVAYKAGDKVVYPAHGVGRVEGVEKLSVAGVEVTLYTITFEKDRMRLKLPLQKVATSGLRRLTPKDKLAEVFQTMKGRARIRRVMWSRRAQEYEAKINSGSPIQVAEVLRDLKRNVTSTEHSYSERQVFQQALERLASEYAAIENIAEDKAAEKLQALLTEAA